MLLGQVAIVQYRLVAYMESIEIEQIFFLHILEHLVQDPLGKHHFPLIVSYIIKLSINKNVIIERLKIV